MSDTGHTAKKAPKKTRDERLAEQLRANLKRRKQAVRKSKAATADTTSDQLPKD